MPPGSGNMPGEEEMCLSFSIDGITSARSETESADESAIESVCLLFFSGSGTLVASVDAEIPTDSQNRLSFKIPLILQENTPYRLLAIANAHLFLPEGYDDYLAYIGNLSRESIDNSISPVLHKKEALTAASIRLLPMRAETNFTFTRNNGECHSNASLTFRKLVSRIDIVNETTDNLRIVSAAICNWRDEVNAADPTLSNGEMHGIYANESDGVPEFVDFAEGSDYLSGALYCFPTPSGVSEPGDQHTTSVILKAYWQDDTEATYYRVNIGEKGQNVKMEANMRYTLTIKSVKGRGSTTPAEAYRSAETIFVPFIPDQDVALIPLTDKRVSIDHDNRTIEIEALDTDNFNGFIDIPFMMHIDSAFGPDEEVYLGYDSSDGLNWPLEGRISMSDASDYCYCEGSYGINGKKSLYSKSKGKTIELTAADMAGVSLNLKNGDHFFISVGAMAPDDPPIERIVTIDTHLLYGSSTTWGYMLEYKVKIKPGRAIINDVVISDDNGDFWMIMDRNVQSSTAAKKFLGYDQEGNRRQAYNYSHFIYTDMYLPFKVLESGEPMPEDYHEESLGYTSYNSSRYSFSNSLSSLKSERTKWLSNFTYQAGAVRRSPFYESDNINAWVYPPASLIDILPAKIRVSKMRMYLVSDIPAAVGGERIPVCCYLPYFFTEDNLSSSSTHCYATCKGMQSDTPDEYVLIYPTPTEIKTYRPSPSILSGMSRLIRRLSDDETRTYKENYLGYGSPCMLKECHSDTYPDNNGW